MSIKEMYNRNLITLEVCEDLLNRTCFYKRSEYEVRLEDGKIILDIYEHHRTVEYDLDTHHWGI